MSYFWYPSKKRMIDNINDALFKRPYKEHEKKEFYDHFYNTLNIACDFAIDTNDNDMATMLVHYDYYMSMNGWYISRIRPEIMEKLKKMKEIYCLEVLWPKK